MTADRDRRAGFTLVELLVAALIVGILAALSAVAIGHALESAKVAKTHALIARLDALVMQRWESYRFRRIPLEMPSTVRRPSDRQIIATPPSVAAQVRCDALRQLMRLEMPERWSDIGAGTVPVKLWLDPLNKVPYMSPTTSGVPATVSMPPSSVSQSYLAFLQSVAASAGFKSHGFDHQGAKCLYLFVTMGMDDPDVLENFSADEIADPDGSGCKCFLDGWGNPIEFLRWAPGYGSRLQPLQSLDADQTDPTQVYGSPAPTTTGMPRTFALYPLIYSAGPDGLYDIVNEADPSTAQLNYGVLPATNNPFFSAGGAGVGFSDGPIGAPAVLPLSDRQSGRGLGSSDNIDSHSLGRR